MDCYSVDSEADPLDFLSPPVKRINTAFSKGLPFELVNLKNKKLKGFYKKNTSAIPQSARTGLEPSTPLVLKKTSQTQFLEQYSGFNYTTICSSPHKPPPQKSPKITRNKPLIKVTVFPKTDQNQNTKLYSKRRHVPKKVQSTSSNQENSIQAKNVYLVVAGRRKEKIYEIRTTGSAEFSNDQITQNEETPINDLLNFKQLVQSLNMDKKRKKEKRENNYFPQTSYNGANDSTECNCTNTSIRDGVSPNKSRVRIYGQLGLTEDDRYVLKYGASVDDKPIMDDVAQLINDFSAFPTINNDEDSPTSFNSLNCLADCNKTRSILRNLRDSCVQADFENDCEFQKPIYKDCECKNLGKGSQATQVNFNIQFAKINKVKTVKQPKCMDKIVQCYCPATDERSKDCDEDASNECNNPLVVISVYPKQNTPEFGKSVKTTIENKRSPSPTKANVYNRKIDKTTVERSVEPSRRDKIPRMNRSPSPAKRVSKTRLPDNKPIETRVVRTFRERERISPEPTSAQKHIKENIHEKNIETTSPKRSRFNTPSITKPQVFNTKPQILRNQQNTKKTKLRSHDMGTNTDHLQAKKALVDGYTKKLSSRMTKTDKPTVNTSKVTININDEKEYYDVLFNQDDAGTDLTVRKKGKDTGSQRGSDEESCTSLENLLLLPEMKPRTRSLSFALYDNQSQCGTPLTKHVSRLTIRDSLEICHRREDKASHGIKNTQTCLLNECNGSTRDDTEFLAPIKHYIGDDCCIYDPMVRDREIRQLLGVEKCRPSTSKTQQEHTSEKHDASPDPCFYRKICDNKIVTDINVCPILKMRTNAPHSDKKRNPKINKTDVERTSLYQQLVLKKNVQVSLQVQQTSKEKPIILTRKQYNKVKRTILKTNPKNICHQKSKYRVANSKVSVGEVKTKKKIHINILLNKEVQTNIYDQLKGVEEKIQEILDFKIEPKTQKLPADKRKTSKCDKSKGRKDVKEICGDANDKEIYRVDARRTVSSVEVYFANVLYKHVTFSSKGKFSSATSFEQVQRKSPTPNLGTSIYSLYSEDRSDSKAIKVLMEPRDPKHRKPLLKRLVSYLVMRSNKGSNAKLNLNPAAHPLTRNSSVDSYHINSSLAGAEVTSSIYDTSESFYSNHTNFPVNKIKRGIFNANSPA